MLEVAAGLLSGGRIQAREAYAIERVAVLAHLLGKAPRRGERPGALGAHKQIVGVVGVVGRANLNDPAAFLRLSRLLLIVVIAGDSAFLGGFALLCRLLAGDLPALGAALPAELGGIERGGLGQDGRFRLGCGGQRLG